jgi:hypothetical protein
VPSSRRRFASSYLTTSGCETPSAGRCLPAERASGRQQRPRAHRADVVSSLGRPSERRFQRLARSSTGASAAQASPRRAEPNPIRTMRRRLIASRRPPGDAPLLSRRTALVQADPRACRCGCR